MNDRANGCNALAFERQTLLALGQALAEGRMSSQELAGEYLGRIKEPASEGARTYIRLNPHLMADAARADAARSRGGKQRSEQISPLQGIPVSVKDLFDIAGEVTTAGSRVLAAAPAARRDSAVVARLKAAGMLIVGTTNMTEFAYSGLGLNPHYGTPRNPFDRAVGRIPGGSSSGAAVSVADACAAVAIGTDTSGSCRIPAALCGLVGFKPTARRVPKSGVIPLSPSLDAVGPLARSVACCALIDAVLATDADTAGSTSDANHAELPARAVPQAARLADVRIGRLVNYVEAEVEPAVACAYEAGLARLESAGAQIVDVTLTALDLMPELLTNGGLAAAEAYAWHKHLIEDSQAQYDPRVARRILMGASQGDAAYRRKLQLRGEIIERANLATRELDCLCLPSVAMTAPRIDALQEEDVYVHTNLLMLRNPGVANVLDRPAISLPIADASPLPVGLTLMGETMRDRRLLAIALAAESALTM